MSEPHKHTRLFYGIGVCGWLAITAYGSMMFFGLHGAACNMHVAAVEMYVRRHGGDMGSFDWSYQYCRVVGAPLRALVP